MQLLTGCNFNLMALQYHMGEALANADSRESMTRREKFQDSNALVHISRQLKAAAVLPAVTSDIASNQQRPTFTNTGVQNVTALREGTVQAADKLKPRTSRQAANKRTGATSEIEEGRSRKARKVEGMNDIQRKPSNDDRKTQHLHSVDASGHNDSGQAAKLANSEAQLIVKAAVLPASEQCALWYTSSYTQAFAEELAAMHEGQNMSQSQLKLLLRVLKLGGSSFLMQHQNMLAQLVQPANACAVRTTVAAWL